MARTDSATKKKPQRKKQNGSNDGLLKEQIGKMGGTDEDFDLVKSKGKQKEVSSDIVDPGLTKDVSQFLKDLKLGKPSKVSKQKPQPVPTKEPKSSENAKTKAANPSKKSKKAQGSSSTKDTSEKPEAPPPPPPAKAIPLPLPTKITVDSRSRFTFQPVSSWHSALPPLKQSAPLTSSQLEPLLSKAASLHASDVQVFKASSSASGSEAAFFSKIISSGTLSDRLSALTLLVQSSPLHNVQALETLKTMAERGKGSGGREESLKALRCIVDWWIGGGAPERKLKYFRDQPLASAEVTDEYLVLWYFEDWLKKYFFAVLQILEALSLDPLVYVRTQALRMIATLLREKPEQEQNLLRLLVNKLGDNERALSSRTSHHILELLQKHPSMKAVVVKEMLALVLRPATTTAATTPSEVAGRRIKFDDDAPKKKEPKTTTNQHARYYATITFNQIVLTPQDKDVSDSLLDVYFELFKELLGEDPAAEHEQEQEQEGDEVKVDSKGRIFNARKKKEKRGGKKEVLRKGEAGFTEGVEDANSKLVSAILTGVNRALPFCSKDDNRVPLLKHIETLFKITHTSTFNISLQALVLIQQVSASSPSSSVTDRYFRTLYASLQDPRLASSNKQAMYLNLLFKSIKADENQNRIVAMVHRFLQVLVSGGNSGAVEFVAGGLFLLGELFSSIPGLRSSLNSLPKETTEEYDPKKRDPQYANAGSIPLWELTPLLNHFHPTIALHANQLLRSVPLTASADLSLNTLSHFLDRFVYKNPKQKKKDAAEEGRGGSAMQPMASAVDGVKLVKGEVLDKSHLVNEAKFAKKSAKDLRPDELFFHKYFTTKAKGRKSAVVEEEGQESDDEEKSEDGDEEEMDLTGDEEADAASSDDEEEKLIWNAMKASMPKTGEGDADLDLLNHSDSDVDSALQDMSDDEDMLDMVEEDDDILSDSEVGLIDYEGSSSDEDGEDPDEEWGGVDGTVGKRKRDQEDGEPNTRKKKKALPTFASYEDYAKMIEDGGPEDDI